MRLSQFWCLPIILILVGCGKSGPEIAPVSGRITVNGQPMENVDITFQLDGSKPPSSGRTDKDGHYELAYKRGQMGGMVGQNTVRISVSSELVHKPPKIPPEYNTQSKQQVEIKSGQKNTFDFDIKTAEK